MAQKPQDLSGVVVIFDSADGGMIAATTTSLQQWVTGKLSDAAMWHQCFFDPPEIVYSAEHPETSKQRPHTFKIQCVSLGEGAGLSVFA